jgi:hypothetical protein
MTAVCDICSEVVKFHLWVTSGMGLDRRARSARSAPLPLAGGVRPRKQVELLLLTALRVDGAHTGLEGLARLEEQALPVVLLDILVVGGRLNADDLCL